MVVAAVPARTAPASAKAPTAAGHGDEPAARGDLGSHRADGEAQIAEFGQIEVAQWCGLRGAEARHDGGHVGQHEQPVGLDVDRRHGGDEVLLDDGLDAPQPALAALGNRGAAAAKISSMSRAPPRPRLKSAPRHRMPAGSPASPIRVLTNSSTRVS